MQNRLVFAHFCVFALGGLMCVFACCAGVFGVITSTDPQFYVVSDAAGFELAENDRDSIPGFKGLSLKVGIHE